MTTETNPRLVTFAGGTQGEWQIVSIDAVVGETMPAARWLSMPAADSVPRNALWILRGVASNERYVARGERNQLIERQEPLGRAAATCAALIPIRKRQSWWELPQDERRAIFEESSQHIRIGLKYLPAVARRLHHSRDLSPREPFDFLTWFEYAPAAAASFERLVQELRASEEWKFVDREVDIRLVRASA